MENNTNWDEIEYCAIRDGQFEHPKHERQYGSSALPNWARYAVVGIICTAIGVILGVMM